MQYLYPSLVNFKPVKGVGKVAKVPMIKTGEVPGKPEWFDSLVNKVILEGDDVSKKFATKEREIVHTKKLDKDTEVSVIQDLDEGSITHLTFQLVRLLQSHQCLVPYQ